MFKITLMLAAFATTVFGCSNEVCNEAADIAASCITTSGMPAEDIECPSGSLERCTSQCTVDFQSDYCDILDESADAGVIDAFDDCVAACAAITTPTEPTTDKKTE